MTVFNLARIAAICAPLALVAASLPVQAQVLRPPADIRVPADSLPLQRAQDAAGQNVRVDRLENQIRNLTGQIEQLQFQNRKLEEQLRKVQADMEFRFQELGGKPGALPPKRSDGAEVPRQPVAQPVVPPLTPPIVGAPPIVAPRKPPRNVTQGDAFDPATQPNAPGSPRPLGGPAIPGPTSILPAASLPGGPIDPGFEPDAAESPVQLGQPHGGTNGDIVPLNPGGVPLAGVPLLGVPLAGVPLVPAGAVPVAPLAPGVAALPPQPPLDDYQAALASLKLGQYEVAEQSLRSFIVKNPRSHRVPDATFYLGETYFQRSRHREAAEQYLKVTTDFSGSSRAPEGMLRLGMALKAMGAGEQACATFGEITRKYPAASVTVRKGAEREMQRNKC